jgi:hypothetical protein
VIETTAPTTATKNERKERKKEERKRKIITRYSRITLHIVRTAYEQAQDMGVPMGGWGVSGGRSAVFKIYAPFFKPFTGTNWKKGWLRETHFSIM